jgi:hypothetical protein
VQIAVTVHSIPLRHCVALRPSAISSLLPDRARAVSHSRRPESEPRPAQCRAIPVERGIEAVHVPFEGGPGALSEVMAGRVDFFFSQNPT